MLLQRLFGLCAVATLAAAHGSHSSDVDPAENWALYHMQEEHHISNFDAPSFFSLHDFNSDGYWTADEIRRIYGLEDESLANTAADVKDHAVAEVIRLFDQSSTGRISKEDWLSQTKNGVKLPDFGLGPGHHGDDEYEYEIHHFEKFHGEDTREEDLIHPEDIAHFRKHDQMEDEAYRVKVEQSQQIVEHNIPMKFRKQH